MKFLRKWFQSRAEKAAQWEPVTGEKFRQNVIENSTRCIALYQGWLPKLLQSDPPAHPGDVFSTAELFAKYSLELGMIDWRAGIDPRPHFTMIHRIFAQTLEARPDILADNRHSGFLAVVSGLVGWDFPFFSDPPGEDVLKFDILWMERWIVAGLADPSCWPLKAQAPRAKIQFVNKCLDDYWALLTDQIDPEEGIRRCIRNYDRRATHPTFKAMPGYMGGGAYNELFVDYTLAAILKQRGLTSGSVHDWVWG